MADERSIADLMNHPGWDIPVTEGFVGAVRAGIGRRRRLAVVAAAALVALVLAGAGAVAIAARPAAVPAGRPTPELPRAQREIDGFLLGYLPGRLARDPALSQDTARVGPGGLDRTGPQPSAGEPGASIRIVRFVGPGYASVYITVLRPIGGPNPQISQWLADYALRGADVSSTLGVAVGTAYLIRGGSTGLVIVGSDASVLIVEAGPPLALAELRQIALGLSFG